MSNQVNDIKHEVNGDDLNAVMKKYDRESNVRIWTGKPALIVKTYRVFAFLYLGNPVLDIS